MNDMKPTSTSHEDSVDPRPVGVNQSLNNWSSDDRACRTTNRKAQCSAGKAPCPEFQLESYTCTAVTDSVPNAKAVNHNKAANTLCSTKDLINGGYATNAPLVTMEDLMQATSNNFLLKAVNMLGALQKSGVLFRVVTSDGQEYGTLPYAKELVNKKVRRKRGSLSKHIDPHLAKMKAGDVGVIEIPTIEDLSINAFQARVSARMCQLWGAANGICHRNENTIEVLRIK